MDFKEISKKRKQRKAHGSNFCLIWNLKIYSDITCAGIIAPWHCSVVVITTAQLHSTKPGLKFCSGSNPARGVPEFSMVRISNWQTWSQLEIKLNGLCRSTIPQKKFIIIIAIKSSTRKWLEWEKYSTIWVFKRFCHFNSPVNWKFLIPGQNGLSERSW